MSAAVYRVCVCFFFYLHRMRGVSYTYLLLKNTTKHIYPSIYLPLFIYHSNHLLICLCVCVYVYTGMCVGMGLHTHRYIVNYLLLLLFLKCIFIS